MESPLGAFARGDLSIRALTCGAGVV